MFVNEQDQQFETWVFESIHNHLFPGTAFKHALGASIFDFISLNGQIELDVKVRDCESTAYPDYFVSADKVRRMKQYPLKSFYVAYYFLKDQKVRVYNLSELEEREIEFKHKRSGENIKSHVFCINSAAHLLDAYLYRPIAS